MKVYLAGKITDDPNYKAKFARATYKFPADTVISPAVLPSKGLSKGDYMRICFAMIDSADVVAFLPDWKESLGATVEHEYCQYIGKPILYI